jgi:hypothetical protein
MTTALHAVKEAAVHSAHAATDQRRHRRVALALLGRFMRANKHEYPCRLNDISVGGAAINSPIETEMGERIVVYFDHIGGLEGHVVRVFEGGFAMEFKVTARKREKLAAQLTYLINRDVVNGSDQRLHERTSVGQRTNSVLLDTGETLECEVIDVSLSGASLKMEQRPPVGLELTLGRLKARIVRHHEQGIGVRFVDIQEPEALRRHFS